MIVSEEIENKEIAKQYKKLLQISYQTLSNNDKRLIRSAFDTAVDAHRNQRRKSGEPYVLHPISVAKIVAQEIGLDATSIAAALLHDVIEDTDYSFEDIEKLFGTDVSRIVEGLTKISKMSKEGNVSLQAENFRKLLLTVNDDVRVIIIKIADRLHNMQTLDVMPEHKQVKTASETLYIYAPLSHRIGLYNIKTELEDLSFKYTESDRYLSIKNKIEDSRESQDEYIRSFSEIVQFALAEEGLEYQIKGRSKSIFSINRKMTMQNIPFENVFDKFAIRIIYSATHRNEKFLAWKIYSIITDHFIPNPTRLRDWITAPRSNGYEALHITVMGPNNKWVEVQIRSERMDEIAEKGYAAHHKYKQGEQKDIGIESWLDKLHELLENNNENPVDFVENFKLNLYAKEIFVFTPTGEIKSLPKGATALDFAFSIHTEVGMKTRGARVNGKLVPLSRTLKSGENIEIITSDNIKPTANWLDFVQTSRAKSKIKSSLNEEKKIIAEDGRETLRRKLKQLKITLNDKTIRQMLGFFNLNNSLDLFYRVGLGTINNKQLKKFSTKFNGSFLNFFKKRIRKQSADYKKEDKGQITQRFDTLVFGKEKEILKHSLSPCCKPIAGDPVFGFVSLKEGVKVHKKDCANALSLQSNFAYRIIKAKWVDSSADEFTAILKLSGIDNMGIVSNVTQSISGDMNVNINKLSFDSEDGIFTGLISVNVKNKTILNKLINTILKVKGVDKVLRK
tara:strand:+ start:2376 stop:4580 length:2205 start_codon:yes stop_codon:yes gene_type:complete